MIKSNVKSRLKKLEKTAETMALDKRLKTWKRDIMSRGYPVLPLFYPYSVLHPPVFTIYLGGISRLSFKEILNE